jgi:integrase
MDIQLDQYPYTAYQTALQTIVLPRWANAADSEALAELINIPGNRDRIQAEMSHHDWSRIKIATCATHPEYIGQSIEEGFDPQEVPLVFPDSHGGYFWGSNFDRNVWHPIREAAGLPDSMTFHDLRHTQASLMLDAGADMKVIQARLGHTKYETTANLYAHLLQGAQAEASNKLDALMARKKS